MQQIGIIPGDVVTICANNTMESYVVFFATLLAGATVASLDPSLSPEDVEHLLKQVDPKLIFAGKESVNLIERVLSKLQNIPKVAVFGNTKNHLSYANFLIKTGNEDTFQPVPVKNIFDTAVIFFSSGTTGLPKGICATHYGLLAKFDSKENSMKL